MAPGRWRSSVGDGPTVESCSYYTKETLPVRDAIARDTSVFRFLSQIDAELATKTRGGGCQHCSGLPHTADSPRKHKGCPAEWLIAVVACFSSNNTSSRNLGRIGFRILRFETCIVFTHVTSSRAREVRCRP